MDLDELERLAKEAEYVGPSPWKAQEGDDRDAVYGDDGLPVADCVTMDEAQYIAAANPAVVLALIERVRKAEAQLAKSDEYEERGGLSEEALAGLRHPYTRGEKP